MAGPYLICWVKDLDPVSFLGLVWDTTGSICLASLDGSQGISGSASGLSLGSKVIPSDAEEMCPCALVWELLFAGLCGVVLSHPRCRAGSRGCSRRASLPLLAAATCEQEYSKKPPASHLCLLGLAEICF